MTEQEKVMKGLECCSKIDMCCMEISCYYPKYLECPYDEDEDCVKHLVKDALKLLKEKETEVEIEGGGSTWFYVCGECHTSVSKHSKYCRECGRRLIWENTTLK